MNITNLCFIFLALFLSLFSSGCFREDKNPEYLNSGIVIDSEGMVQLHEKTTKAIESIPSSIMQGPGIVGAMGGISLKLLKTGAYDILIVIPQLADSQIPITYSIVSVPLQAVSEYRLIKRDDSNYAVVASLNGERDQQILISWTSVVLLTEKTVIPNSSVAKNYIKETLCVQAGSEKIQDLSKRLRPEGKNLSLHLHDYARNIQDFIMKMKQKEQPRSLDAIGILDSGCNWICTANANIASALFRANHIPARSIAVIPAISQTMEMHRIVEYYEGSAWIKFDPSSLFSDIPLMPWQNIIMAKTTIDDEDIAMKPRYASAVGSPYGQELELFDSGITLWGSKFFWTIAKPLALFEADPESIDLAVEEWTRFLETGRISQSQIKAGDARDKNSFQDSIKQFLR